MALVMSPCFAPRLGRNRFSLGAGPLCVMRPRLVIIQIPQAQLQQARHQPGGRCSTTTESVETPNDYIFKVGMPGLKKEDIHVEVLEDDRTLHIRVGHPIKDQEAKQGPHASSSSQNVAERSASGSRLRLDKKLRLPENADMDEIRAEIIEGGMMTITVPKQKMKAPVSRNIEVTAGAAKSAASSDPKSSQATPATPENNNGVKLPAAASEQPSTSTSKSPGTYSTQAII